VHIINNIISIHGMWSSVGSESLYRKMESWSPVDPMWYLTGILDCTEGHCKNDVQLYAFVLNVLEIKLLFICISHIAAKAFLNSDCTC